MTRFIEDTMQTLDQALTIARTSPKSGPARAARALDGLPVGGWGETAQAIRRLDEQLPGHWERDYTTADFIGRAYTVDENERYRSRM